MKRLRNWLVCQVIGHDINPCDCYATRCFRCGLEFPWVTPPRSDLGFWLDWFTFKERFLKRFFRRDCECCGKRLKKGQMFSCGTPPCDEWMPF